jgi:creatinine amidohydrolase/Fe(II)-dependent formamide hydrolase-like protein
MRTSGIAGVSANGVLGDPTTATSEHGIAVMNLYSASLIAHLATLSNDWLSDSQ